MPSFLCLFGYWNFFFFQHLQFTCNHFSFALAVETARTAIGGYDAVARHFGSKRIPLERLSDGLCAAATNTTCQFAVRDAFSPGNVEQFLINFSLERGNVL